MLVSAVQQRKLAIIIRRFLLRSASLPFPYLTHLSHHRAPGWAPCVTEQLFRAICFTHDSVSVWTPLSPFVPKANPLQPPGSGSEKLGREKLGWAAAFYKQLWRNVSKTRGTREAALQMFQEIYSFTLCSQPPYRTQFPQKLVFSSCTKHKGPLKEAAAHLFSRHNIQGKRQ